VNVAALVCRPVRIPLGPGPRVEDLIRRIDGWDGLVCLHGAWADGAAVLTSHPAVVHEGAADPIAVLSEQPVVMWPEGTLGPGPLGGVGPVGGGWFGRLAFDGASRVAFHDHVVRLVGGTWQFEALWSDARAPALEQRLAAWRAVLAGPSGAADGDGASGVATWRVGPFAGPAAADHLAAVERAVELIRAGELYQVNVCTRLSAAFAGSAAALFADCVSSLAPGYGAYLAGRPAVVSLSPELFLRRRGRSVESAPIKGTRPRTGPDDGNADALRRSTKDRAENVMIVDLVRNDLGRVSETGSVRPGVLLDVQPHPGVWHLVSTVTGRMRAGTTDADLLRAAFPPGSVTGAPKLRALAAIAALEPAPRGTYTGAIGFASPLWGAEFSVAIRSFEIADGRIELGVGGGITADSVPMLEWQECGHKAAPLVRAARSTLPAPLGGAVARPDDRQRTGGLLETILALDGRPLRLADHLARLDRSARELYGTGAPDDLGERVQAAARGCPADRSVVRVVLRPDRAPDVTAMAAGAPPAATDLTCVPRPDGLWRHKWADRSWVREAPRRPLFVAADGTVLETDRGNVFLLDEDGTLVTPPLRDDLLPGVTRRALLDLARDLGRPTALRGFDLDEMRRRPAFWTSSLSGAVPIHALDGVPLPRADDLVANLSGHLTSAGPSTGGSRVR
jgi:para-aminobenzoate synthetase / 4-amino-4-deoxychorismate lyase